MKKTMSSLIQDYKTRRISLTNVLKVKVKFKVIKTSMSVHVTRSHEMGQVNSQPSHTPLNIHTDLEGKEREAGRQTDRDRQRGTERKRERQADRQKGRDTETGRQADRQADGEHNWLY